jgi:pyruvate/2-oxoglutarate dehydrogenase complex dihydrolipoamide dehydrogenase (E3) component
MTEEKADIVMLGLGTGGEELALRLAQGGLDVVGIEPQLLGGECPYWACIPSKMMIRAANLLEAARRVNGVAGRAEVTPDWAPLAKRIREEATGGWDDSMAVARFEAAGGRFVRGWGKLTGPDTVAVGDRSFKADRGIILATGSRPIVPPIPGLSEVEAWSTHDVIKAETLPSSLLVLGGGAVGCELGQVLSRFGVDVTIVEAHDRLLPGEEPETSLVVATAFEAEGIAVHLGAPVERIERRGDQVVATLAGGAELSASEVLVAVGRTVDLSGLGLESAGLDASGPFVPVDERMHAGERIWAMGDITGKAMFTHMAVYHATIIAADLLGEDCAPADYRATPRACFTDPEVGAVGLTEAQARGAGHDVVVVVKQVPATFRGWIHGAHNHGVIKLVVDRSEGVLLGATSVGPHGAEVLGTLSTAVHARVRVAELRSMIWAYPTFHGAIGEALGAYGRAITKLLDPDNAPLLEP